MKSSARSWNPGMASPMDTTPMAMKEPRTLSGRWR